jgi:hypothetical protein
MEPATPHCALSTQYSGLTSPHSALSLNGQTPPLDQYESRSAPQNFQALQVLQYFRQATLESEFQVH